MKIDFNELPKYAGQALQKPEDFGYWGDNDMFKTWGFTGIDKTDASDILEISNFEVISKDLIERYPDDFRIETYKHWAVNSVDRLVCRILKSPGDVVEENITNAFIAAMTWHNELDEYSIANEDHYLEMEHAEMVDMFNNMEDYLKNMINPEKENWAEELYYELANNMGVELYQHCEIKDNDVLKAILNSNLCNPERWGEWNEWCDEQGFDRPIFPVKENPKQLKLFED
jgi:hypothetical protein